MHDDETFTIELKGFRGPLELLLDLIESEQLDINDISLAYVAKSYIAYINDARVVPLSQTAHFIRIAATLLLIKSRSLLPNIELTTEEEADITDLERRLERYKVVRRAARHLDTIWGERMYLPKQTMSRIIRFSPGKSLTTHQLTDALHALIETAKTFTPPTARVTPTIRLEDVIASLTSRIRSGARSYKNIVAHSGREEAIVHFLALLELVRHGEVTATQRGQFDDIVFEHDTISTPHYA